MEKGTRGELMGIFGTLFNVCKKYNNKSNKIKNTAFFENVFLLLNTLTFFFFPHFFLFLFNINMYAIDFQKIYDCFSEFSIDLTFCSNLFLTEFRSK